MSRATSHRQETADETLGLLRRVAAQAFAPRDRGAGPPSFTSLHHLALHFSIRKQGASQREIARYLGVTPGHVTGILDDLEREGVIRRRPDLNDRRIHRVEATLKAEDLHRRFHGSRARRGDSVFRGWSEDDLEGLRELLVRLDAELNKDASVTPSVRRARPSRATSGSEPSAEVA